ncbi:Por secretion system C-terminal sorting domain-containing protein [Reichenbachiella agariperforans]|uniref:Por secretion system C-terminal sorting domain-containing protein n=1 Tax=Reichenbachiella agariperforans TaxID=156994 RepID=A0A1M6KPM7_REIAG|nr:carbohydrate-binding protein [Reichenbachiella agariperforans]SHJ60880.1 Por secretion system C-terminal sorting domain-containing protein [Reichenbachiella agariperforans]
MKDSTKTKVKHYLTYLCLLVSFTTVKAQNLLWSDEFDGTTLDQNIWSYAIGDGSAEGIPGWGNQELQTYTDQNTSVSNGILSITARRENVNGKEFTSARLLTKDKLSVKYGMIEASIKLPDMNNGLWPAFWMLGDANRWPFTGEIDIMEAGFNALSTDCNDVAKANVFWRAEDAGVTGNLQYGNEEAFKYDASIEAGKQLNDDFFVYRAHWTPDSLTTLILQTDAQGEPIESTAKVIFSIPNTPTFQNEFFSGDNFYILLNLAVGGWLPFDPSNGENTAANVSALPNPGSESSMQIDYVRVYDISGQGQVTLGNVEADLLPAQGFGIYDETHSTPRSLGFGVDSEIFTWEAEVAPSLTIQTVASIYGDSAYSITFPANQWAGLGFNSSDVLNFTNYSNGSLRFKFKTSSQEPFRISAESANGSAGIDFLSGEEKYGLVRDGQWHDVEIPLSLLITNFQQVYMPLIIGNVEFNEPSTNLTIEIDEIHYSSEPSTQVTKVVPALGDYGLFTESAVADELDLGTEGELFVWGETLIAGTPQTFDGQAALSYTHNNKGWFGFAFTANELHDLSAFQGGYLHLAMKSSATETLEMRINVGLQEDVIYFEAGSDPYGFARDGQWHEIEIPLADFESVNFANVLQLLSISGAGNISDIAIADVYYKYDGSNTAPTAVISTNQTSGNAPLAVQFSGAGSTDTDGDPLSYSWDFGDGHGATTASTSHSYTATGSYTASLTVSDGSLTHTASVEITVTEASVCAGSTPLPALIQAEDYNSTSGTDTEATSDTDGGLNVGWIDQGDWMDYILDVPNAGNYTIDLRIAGDGTAAKSIDLLIDGNSTATVNFNGTGGWQNWTTVNSTITLNAGCQTLRLSAATGGFNINWIDIQSDVFTPVVTSLSVSPSSANLVLGQTQVYTAQAFDQNGDAMSANINWSANGGTIDQNGTYTATAEGNFTISAQAGSITTTAPVLVTPSSTGLAIPGSIEAEDYSDASGIQTETTTDAGGGINVGYIDAGDWLDYEVNVTASGNYTVAFRVAAAGAGQKTFDIQSNSSTLTNVTFTATGGWQAWTTVTSSVSLSAGSQTLRLAATSSGFNINRMDFSLDEAPVLTTITVLPNNATIDEGQTQQYSAQGYDQNGDPIAASYTWSASGGSINSSGLYTASSAGNYVITATSGSISANTNLTVNSTATGCTGGPSNGDYTYSITGGNTPALTFEPGYAGVGASLAILYYGTNPTGPYPGYGVSPNTPLTLSNVSEEQTVYFYYTYSVPEGGERNTAANPHSFVVGSSCSGARTINSPAITQEKQAFTLYPNPTTHHLQVNQSGMDIEWMEILDLTGKSYQQLQWTPASNGITLDLSHLPNGVYMLRLHTAQKSYTQRFIKQ